MSNNEDFIYGMRIVPRYDKNGVIYGGAEGIVIGKSYINNGNICICKMVYKEDGYFPKFTVTINFKEVLEHSSTSGEEKAKFLYSEAMQYNKENEPIFICEDLVLALKLLDVSWHRREKIAKERKNNC